MVAGTGLNGISAVALDARLVGGESTGDSTYWTGLLHGRCQIPLNFKVLLYSNAPKPPGIPWCDAFEWICLPSRNSRWWSLVRFPLAARRAADVLHVQYNLSPLAGRRAITTVHDVSFLIGPQWFRPRDRFLLQKGVPAAIRRAAAVVTVSETSRREIEQLIPGSRGKTHAVYNACPPWVEPVHAEEARRFVSAQYGISEPFLYTVGTRWPRKNMRLAVEAVERLPTSQRLPLVISGKAGWGEAGGEQGGSGSWLRTLGYVPREHLGALYSAARLYLAPSLHEGFGIPLLEAFRCGCPVLSSQGGALPEVAGDAALIEPTWDPDHWSATLADLLGDSSKLESLRAKGLAREREFTWQKTARATVEIYRGISP
jgi:glycosyltransferase involved in cell wall biosynthesis